MIDYTVVNFFFSVWSVVGACSVLAALVVFCYMFGSAIIQIADSFKRSKHSKESDNSK